MNASLRRSILIALLALGASPVFAQSTTSDPTWTGFYLGGYVGAVSSPDDANDRILFDTNLDGNFNDTVRTSAGADAFSPGFCDGSAVFRTPADGCNNNGGGAEWGVRAGYDWQVGDIVFGVVGDYGMNDARDAVSAFSTTPASYTMLRKVDSVFAIRGRVGLAYSGSSIPENLFYVTAGYAQASIENSFQTTNATNSFTSNGDSDADGAQYGIGYEFMFNEHFSAGIEYLYTNLKDDEARVRAGPGTALPTNPFLIANPSGTDFRRSDEDFDLDSLHITATYRF
jgi:opacity protein-like surface antigen